MVNRSRPLQKRKGRGTRQSGQPHFSIFSCTRLAQLHYSVFAHVLNFRWNACANFAQTVFRIRSDKPNPHPNEA